LSFPSSRPRTGSRFCFTIPQGLKIDESGAVVIAA